MTGSSSIASRADRGRKPERARTRVVFAIAAVGSALATLDQLVVNVAFPAISHGLHGDISTVSWVLNGYSIVFAALLVPAGRLADRSGLKRGFVIGVAVFTIASLACAVSGTLAELITARVVQGAGAAMLMPSSLGLLLATYPPERRVAAARAWTVVIASTAALAPAIGGLLVTVSWHWIFLVNLPVGLAILALAGRLRGTPAASGGPLPDFAGAALAAVGIAVLSLGLVRGQAWGWASPRTIAAFAAGAALTALFVRRCGRHPSPVIELSLLRVPRFAIAMTATVCYGAAFAALLLSFNLWAQGGWGWSPLHFGLAFVPGPLMVPAMMPLIGRIVKVVGSGVTAALGCLLLAASAVAGFALINRVPDYAGALLPAVLLTGLGVALALPALTGAATEPLPPQRFATGSGILNMSRQLGFTAGVGIAAAVLGSAATGPASLTAFQHAWLVTGLLGVTAAAVATWLAVAARRTSDALSRSNEQEPAAQALARAELDGQRRA